MSSPSKTAALGRQVIWAMGGNRSKDLAHAYVSEEAYQNNTCLCGCGTVPAVRFDDWDLDNKLVREHTCPQCLKRLQLLPYIARLEKGRK